MHGWRVPPRASDGKELVTMSEIRVTTLDNGLTVIVRERAPTAEKSA